MSAHLRNATHLHALVAVFVATLTLGASPRPVAADTAQTEHYVLGALILAAWLPPPPAAGSSTEAADIATFWTTRAAMQGPTPRGRAAAEDDVFDEQAIWQRFAAAAGAPATACIAELAPTLVTLLHKAQQNGEELLRPMK